MASTLETFYTVEYGVEVDQKDIDKLLSIAEKLLNEVKILLK